MGEPLLTVVLPVLNEARDLRDLLGQLRDQIPPPGGFEILVVDGGSTDSTRSIVEDVSRAWPVIRLLDNPRRRSAPARNIGAWSAAGRLVLFVDGHCSIPRTDYLVRTVELFESSGADCLCRPQPLGELAGEGWSRAVALARHSRWGHDPGSDIYGGEPRFTDPRSAGAAYRREVFDRLGGFDERFDACEDVEFNHRVALAGFRAYVHPDLAVHYRPRDSLIAFFRQMFRYGRGRGRLAIRHPGFVPWLLVAASAAGLGGVALAWALGGSRGVFLLLALVAGWLGLCVIAGWRQAGSPLGALRVGACLAAIHAGLCLGFLRGLLDVRRFRPEPEFDVPSGAGARPRTS